MIDLNLMVNELEHADDLEIIELDFEDLIILDPDILEDIKLDLDKEDLEIIEKLQEGGILVYSGKTSLKKKIQSKNNYRKKKGKILTKKKKLKKTLKYKKGEMKKDIMDRAGKTLTGRRKTRYHV